MARANNLKVLATVVAAVVATCLLVLAMVLGPTREAQAIGPNAVRAGFNDNTLARNDDQSTGLVSTGLSQPLNFFGNNYSQLYVNNNGNVTFDQPLATYTPFNLTSTGRVIIAPFFGDVDTRSTGTDPVTYGYGTSTVDGHDAFGVNWINVGYFNERADKLNNFQLVLIDRSDVAPGDFDIEFNYDRVQWETGDFSGGSGGLGGFSARAGFSNGTGASGTSFELPGSAVNGAFLDSNSSSGLIHNSLNSTQPGRYVFQVRNGVVEIPNDPPVVDTDASNALGTEGDNLQTSGAFADPNGDELNLSVPSGTPGTFTDNGDGTWNWELSTTDDVAQSTIEVTADDGNGGTATDSFEYAAGNADPELSSLSLTGNTGTACATNNVGLSFSFSDAGSADTHEGTIDWGDGSQPTAFTSSPVNESHDYGPGTYTITVNLSDDDGGADSDTGSVSRQYKVSKLLAPVNDYVDPENMSVSKYGSTIPLKVRITDCDNNPVSGLTPKISFLKINPATPVVGINEGTSTSNANDDFRMRWSADGQFYIYNLATKSLADGNATYAAIIEDTATPQAFGPTQTQNFGLRTK